MTPTREEPSAGDESPAPAPGGRAEPGDLRRAVRLVLEPGLAIAPLAILAIALLFALHAAQAFFIPVVFAGVLSLILRPLVRRLGKWRVPEPLGAAVVLLLLLGALGYGVTRLYQPALDWAARLPRTFQDVDGRIRELRRPVERVKEAAQQVESIANAGDSPKPTVKVEEESAGDALLGFLQRFLAGGIVMVFLTYLLLSVGERFLVRFVELVFPGERRDQALALVQTTERQVGRYLGTVALINVGLGLAIAAAMAAWGMPNPLLWGALATFANFIPYVGDFLAAIVVGLVALLTFDDVGHAIAIALTYSAISTTEGFLVTPLILGRRFEMNPAVIFTWLVFWGWMWGVAGALLAVPMLATLKIVCEHVVPLRPVARLIAR